MASDLNINNRSVPSYIPDLAATGALRTSESEGSTGAEFSAPIAYPADKLEISINTAKEFKNTELQGKLVAFGEQDLIKMIEKANKAIQGPNTNLEFSIHQKTKAIMVKVTNTETGEVIREIPPEKILDMVAKMCELAGIFVDERR